MIRLIILDISGIYTQIFDEGWYKPEEYDILKERYPAGRYIVVRTA